jgi:hypothetical protein
MASIAWRTSVGGGGEGQAPQPERGARQARGLDARLRLQHHFMPAVSRFTQNSLRSIKKSY